jgi:hypothetical protein
MLKFILRSWTRAESWSLVLAVLSLALAVATGLDSRPRQATVFVICVFAGLISLLFVVLVSRDSFTLRGYKTVMSFLDVLAATAKYRLWTTRAHQGSGDLEESYFAAIEHRLKDPNKPLENFRRVIRLSPSSASHARWLVEHLYNQPGVEIRYYKAGGPPFDFVIVDGKIAVIGFPMATGRDNIGAVVLRRRAAVEGVESAFHALCMDAESTLLFEGSKTRKVEEVRPLLESVQKLVESKS